MVEIESGEIQGGGGLKILVGDDDRINQLVLRGLLKKLGLDCNIVGTGQAVVDAVSEGGYNFVLLDVQLPDIDGFEVARQIQAGSDQSTRPQIAFVSGHDASDFRSELDALGIRDFITKPVTVEALKKVIPGAN